MFTDEPVAHNARSQRYIRSFSSQNICNKNETLTCSAGDLFFYPLCADSPTSAGTSAIFCSRVRAASQPGTLSFCCRIRNALIVIGRKAFVVSVENKTVITALDQQQLTERIVTNIDAAVFFDK